MEGFSRAIDGDFVQLAWLSVTTRDCKVHGDVARDIVPRASEGVDAEYVSSIIPALGAIMAGVFKLGVGRSSE